MSASATKKIDYVKIKLDDNHDDDLVIECGTGLNSKHAGPTPLTRVLKKTLIGDNNLEIESSRER